MNSKELLDELVNLRAKQDLILADRQTAMQSILSPEQILQMAEIDEEYAPLVQATDEEVELLSKKVKQSVLTDGKSCKGDTVEALYIAGKTKWDDAELRELIFSEPRIADAIIPPKPYVTIRTRRSG